MRFVNRAAFDDPKSRQAAMGVDFRTQNAVLDPNGRVLFYAQTGGVLNPQRFELAPGDGVFRFGSSSAGPQKVAKGGWWLQKAEFERLVNFANVWSIAVGMAARALCLVPPEWSDMTLLVRGRVSDPLLAWRGLANAVVTPAAGGGPPVRMPTQNDIAARRVHQLYVPGLADLGSFAPGIRVEQDYPLDKRESLRGFLYL
jgi:hypothetical protein